VKTARRDETEETWVDSEERPKESVSQAGGCTKDIGIDVKPSRDVKITRERESFDRDRALLFTIYRVALYRRLSPNHLPRSSLDRVESRSSALSIPLPASFVGCTWIRDELVTFDRYHQIGHRRHSSSRQRRGWLFQLDALHACTHARTHT